ncbi:MAG: SDR family oxidoreductase [Gammaproteobacteria bacterium]|nr:SDR family oxidoreductase [Gammaproteobacteria bacterium]
MFDRGHVLVTGALGGLGTAIVKRLLYDGARVVATDRRLDTQDAWLAGFDEAERARLRVHALDVTKEDEVVGLATRLAGDGIAVAYLVNNAGVAGAAPPWSMSTKTFDVILRVNLLGTFLCTRAFCGAMTERGFGRIVNFASLYAYRPGPGQAPYAAAKAGIVGYSHSTASDLGPHGVTVNVIAPGLIWHERLVGILPEAEVETVISSAPLQRAGEPREITGTVAFLLSDDAGFITGQVIHVNGGLYMTG